MYLLVEMLLSTYSAASFFSASLMKIFLVFGPSTPILLFCSRNKIVTREQRSEVSKGGSGTKRRCEGANLTFPLMDFFSRVIEFLFFTISSDYSIVSRESVATRKLGSVRGTSTQGKSPTENAFCSSATSFRQTWNLALLYEALSASRARGGEVLPAQKTETPPRRHCKSETPVHTKVFSCWPGAFPLAHAAKRQLNPPSVQGWHLPQQ